MKDDFAEPLEQIDRVFVRWRRRKLLYVAGCDYYRLSSHPKIVQAIHHGLEEFGLNTAASRKTTGNHSLYAALEANAAKFFAAPRAVLSSSGYLANLAVGQALRGGVTRAFVDERAHASVRDGLALIGCPVIDFRHRDGQDLQRKWSRGGAGGRAVIATDGVFAFDGSIPPLVEYRRLAGKEAILWVDDAHAAGVIGARGEGTIQNSGIDRRNVIQTVTFSKAFGVYGGAILCDESFRRALIRKSSVVSGNTPLPLPLVEGVLTALRQITRSARTRLLRNIKCFWSELGQEPAWPQSPIASLRAAQPRRVSDALVSAGIYPSYIRYPGGPAEGYFRFALSSEHTPEQVARLASALRGAPGSISFSLFQ